MKQQLVLNQDSLTGKVRDADIRGKKVPIDRLTAVVHLFRHDPAFLDSIRKGDLLFQWKWSQFKKQLRKVHTTTDMRKNYCSAYPKLNSLKDWIIRNRVSKDDKSLVT